MSNESPYDRVKKELHQIFPDQATAKRVVELVTSHKPPGWSRKSQAPYYKEFFGLQCKGWADTMLRTKSDMVFRYDAFCGEKREIMSENTLYNRINQSKRYLIDCLDPKDVYKTWDALININRTPGLGIVMRFKPEFQGVLEGIEGGMIPESIIPTKEEPLWRRKMNEWLESDVTAPFVRDGLALPIEDVRKLQNELDELAGIQASVTAVSVKIMRMNEE